MSRFNELLHGDLETVISHVTETSLDEGEVRAVLENLIRTVMAMKEITDEVEFQKRCERERLWES